MSIAIKPSLLKIAPEQPQQAPRPVSFCMIRTPTVTSVGAVGQDAVPPIGPAYVTGAAVEAGHKVTAIDAVGTRSISTRGWRASIMWSFMG